jgi:hypothetical protein
VKLGYCLDYYGLFHEVWAMLLILVSLYKSTRDMLLVIAIDLDIKIVKENFIRF